MHRLFALFVFFFALPSVTWAQSSPGAISSESRLVSEVTTITPGKPFTVALELKHPKDWHSYYKNSGGVELPPAITWTLPDGLTAGPIQWPVPEVKDGYFGKSFIYSGSPVFLVEITPGADLPTGSNVTLTADAAWQICKESCINEKKSFTLTLPVGSAAEPDPAVQELFSKARQNIPSSADEWNISATGADGSDLSLCLTPKSAATFPLDPANLDFIPDQPFLHSLGDGGTATQDGDSWVLTLKRRTVDFLDAPIPQGKSFSGTLTGASPLLIPEIAIAAEKAPGPRSQPFSSYLLTLGSMLLGGLILNLMPCVFPVIGLKIMGFVQQAGQDRRKIAFHGLVFTAGVLASFAVISGILFAARAATLAKGGELIGWGYQLQNPWVVLVLMLLMFVLALNMYGVFEIGASATSIGGSLQTKHGLSGTFFSGILATVVATPCSAPFLGAAIGAAVALPSVQFFTAFGAMALGLSLPYLVLSIFPNLINFLPRPGAWMESFKQGMSFLLFATAGYLLWVYAGQIGLENLLGPLFGLSVIAAAGWIHGRWNLPHRSKRARHLALALAIVFSIAGIFLAKPPKPSSLVWEKWSEARVEEVLKEGKPVFIDFTAQWCATCQVNKKRAYTGEVVALMRDKGIVALKADKTNPDPAIEAKLQELGRSAIPVNVLYVPGQKPVVTPEILSPSYLLELFGKIMPADVALKSP